jgi:hypothetical protein
MDVILRRRPEGMACTKCGASHPVSNDGRDCKAQLAALQSERDQLRAALQAARTPHDHAGVSDYEWHVELAAKGLAQRDKYPMPMSVTTPEGFYEVMAGAALDATGLQALLERVARAERELEIIQDASNPADDEAQPSSDVAEIKPSSDVAEVEPPVFKPGDRVVWYSSWGRSEGTILRTSDVVPGMYIVQEDRRTREVNGTVVDLRVSIRERSLSSDQLSKLDSE